MTLNETFRTFLCINYFTQQLSPEYIFLDELASLGSILESQSFMFLRFLSYLGHISRLCLGYVQGMIRICSGYPGYVEGMFRVCSRYVQGMF